MLPRMTVRAWARLCLWLVLAGCTGTASGTDSGDAAVSDGDAGFADSGPADSGTPAHQPTWWLGHSTNEWFAIAGTEGAGGAPVNDYSGMTVTDDGVIVIAAAGGHGGSRDNRVVSLDLLADAPAWVQRSPGSPNAPDNVAYNPDGKPASRHSYQSTQYVAAVHRVMLFGCRFAGSGAYEFPTVDGFDLSTNSWDDAGTWPNVPAGGGYGTVVDADGNAWTTGLRKWTATTQTWSSPITSAAPNWVRWPWASDSKRRELFGLNYGDGQGYGDPVVTAVRLPIDGSVERQVTFAPSAALTQLLADAPTYSGMDYDVPNDRYLFYCGQGTGAGRVYTVTPADGDVWQVGLLDLSGATRPPEAPGSGINNRFRFVPRLKGFVLLPTATSPLYFLKTAN